MTDTPAPLDPDEVECRKCGQSPGRACRQPNGDKAREIHTVRRRDAAAGGPAPSVKSEREPLRAKPARAHTFDPETARAAARKSAQTRARRKAEAAAAVEAAREKAEREAIETEAVKIAEDATRFAKDRAILRRHVLDSALKAHDRLLEALDGFQRAVVDEDGRIKTEPVEEWNRNGDRQIVREKPVTRGWASAETIERLAKVTASTLNSLRLEEGKPTGIERHDTGPGTAETLGEAGVRDLIAWASENLPEAGS